MAFQTDEKRRAYFRARYASRKLRAVEYLGGECLDCGETDPAELQFDHRDDEIKSFKVTDLLGRISWERLVVELDKCDLRCFPCHGKRHGRIHRR